MFLDFNNMAKKIVIIGGGFAGLNALKSIYWHFKKQILKGAVELILISDKNYFLFRPLLHEVVSSTIEREDIAHPLREICAQCGSRFIRGKVIEVNLLRQKIKLHTHETVNYDYLVMALGAKPDLNKIKGADLYSLPLSTLEDCQIIRSRIIDGLEKADFIADKQAKQKYLRILIVGGGPSGVQLATEIRSFFDDIADLYPGIDFKSEVEICIFEASSLLMADFGHFFSHRAYSYLRENRIKVFNNSVVEKIADNYLELADGRVVEGSVILWNAGIKPVLPKFTPQINLQNDRVETTIFLNLKDWPNVFTVGDMACVTNRNGEIVFLPQTAQVASQMGGVIGVNLKNLIAKKPLREFNYRHKGFIVSLGKGRAVADVLGVEFSGILAWFLYRLVYLANMPGFVNKIRIGFDWFLDFFFKRETTEDK